MRKIKIVKITFAGLLIASVAVSMFGQNRPVQAFSGAGDGSQATPFIITTCAQLQEINQELTKYYSLANDIDCSDTANWNAGEGFVPIGNNGCCNNTSSHFKGSFNGNDHVVKNLFINNTGRGSNGTGLFGVIGAEGYVGHVGIQGGNIITSERSGVLVGYNYGTIEQSFTQTNINANGGSFVGGFVGVNYNGIIKNSYSMGNITNAGDSVGGFAGFSNNEISSSYASGNVAGSGLNIGGFVGKLQSGTITNVFATGSVASPGVGGLIGGINVANNPVLTNAHWDSTKSGKSFCWAEMDTTTSGSSNCTDHSANSTYFSSLTSEPFVSFSSPTAVSYLEEASGSLPKFPWHTALAITTPAAPTNIQSEGRAGEVSLNWATSLNEGNSAVSDFSVQYRLSTDTDWTTFGHEAAVFTNIVVDGLTNNVRYDLRVAAVNEVGIGAYAQVDDIMVGSVPYQIHNLQFINNVDSLGATWEVPLYAGTSAITGYDFAYSQAGQDAWGEYPVTSPAAGINGLAVGRYDIRVRAKNIVGNSEWSYVYNKYLGVINYQISNCSDLQNMQDDETGSFTLANDIDCQETQNWNDFGNGPEGFEPIQGFQGNLNGNGHTIRGLYIYRPNESGQGLFQSIYAGASVSYLNLTELEVFGSEHVGGVAGYIGGGSEIDNVHVSGSIYSNAYSGGLVGEASSYDDGDIMISNSTANVSIEASGEGSLEQWGGVVGSANMAYSQLNIYNVNVRILIDNPNTALVGGMIGLTDTYDNGVVNIESSHSSGEIYCGYVCGGAVGLDGGGIDEGDDDPILRIFGFSSSARVNGSGLIGGLIGTIDGYYLQTTIMQSSYDYQTQGSSVGSDQSSSGGLVGGTNNNLDSSLAITRSFAKGGIYAGSNYVGGLVGFAEIPTSITDSYFDGWVSASGYYAGGLVGESNYQIDILRSYASGSYVVSDNDYAGGLAGSLVGLSTVINSFADIQPIASDGVNVGTILGNIAGDFGLENNYVTASHEGYEPVTNCYASDYPNDGSCTLVDTPGYFENNATNPPFDSLWDFTEVWATQTAANPTFQWAQPEDAEISTCQQLQDVSSHLNYRYTLTQDIDCTGFAFQPIGIGIGPFVGSMDGRGHSITGLTITQSNESNVGLFSELRGATVQYITINGTVAGRDNVGGLAGQANRTVNIHHVTSNVDVSASSDGYAGGLIGYSVGDETAYNLLSNCSASGDVIGLGNLGGLIGSSSYTTVENSHASGNVEADENIAGGLIGSSGRSEILKSYATGTVLANENYAGGLVGDSDQDTITDSYATGDASAPNQYYAGGLVGGASDSSIVRTYSTGNVMASSIAGGLIGYINNSSYVTNNFTTSLVMVDENGFAGGLGAKLIGTDYTNSSYKYNNYVNSDNALPCYYDGEQGVHTDSCSDISISASPNFFMQMGPPFIDEGGAAIWDFDTVWKLRDGNYPCLRAETGFCSLDSDSDGVPNSEENDAPNLGDSNNDGQQDADQANVTGYTNIVTAKHAIIETDCSANVGVQNGSEAGSGSEDTNYDYPAGLVGFTATGCGNDVTVTQYYYGTFDISKLTVRKWQNNVYVAIPGAVLSNEVIGGLPVLKVVYHVIDGGPLDDDGAVNGRITDPSGPAILATNTFSSRFSGVGVPNTGFSKL